MEWHCLHKNSYSMLDVGTAGPFDVRLQHATSARILANVSLL